MKKILLAIVVLFALTSVNHASGCASFFQQQQAFAAPSYGFQNFAVQSYAVPVQQFAVVQQPVFAVQQKQFVVRQKNFQRQRVIINNRRGVFRRQQTIIVR